MAFRISHLEAQIAEATVTPAKASTLSTNISAAAVSSGLVLLSAIQPVQASTVVAVAWTTFDASPFVPVGAKFAWLQIDYAITMPDVGVVDAYVHGADDHNTGVILTLAHGRSSGSSDANADCKQIFCKLTAARKFDYEIQAIGFDGGLKIDLIGYVK